MLRFFKRQHVKFLVKVQEDSGIHVFDSEDGARQFLQRQQTKGLHPTLYRDDHGDFQNITPLE